MIRHMLFCFAMLAVVFPAHAEEATPLGQLDLDLSRLKTWGSKVYTFEASRPGSNEKTILGEMTLTTKVTDEAVALTDQFEIDYRGQKLTLDLTHQCEKDNFLSPVRIESKGEGDDELGTFVATVEDGQATIRRNGKEREMELPEGTVTFSAFFRLVTLLPRERGSRVSFPHWLESEELNLKNDFMVECTGQDGLPLGGQNVECTLFRLTGGGIRPAYYWVDGGGVLRQVLIDDRKLLRLKDNTVGQE